MKRLPILGGTAVALGVIATVLTVSLAPEKQLWKTTDVWYHASDVASLGRTGCPQLVEFFHPD
jgi:hypothetical protein